MEPVSVAATAGTRRSAAEDFLSARRTSAAGRAQHHSSLLLTNNSNPLFHCISSRNASFRFRFRADRRSCSCAATLSGPSN